YKSDLDSATLWVEQAENIDRVIRAKRIEAKTYCVYADIHREDGNREAGEKFIERSLAIYRKINVPSDMGEALLEASNYYPGNDDETIKKKRVTYVEALAQFKAAGNKLR